MWSAALASVSAMLSGGVGPLGSTAAAQTAENASAALDVLRKSISVDVHTHGGTTGITSEAPPKHLRASSKVVTWRQGNRCESIKGKGALLHWGLP